MVRVRFAMLRSLLRKGGGFKDRSFNREPTATVLRSEHALAAGFGLNDTIPKGGTTDGLGKVHFLEKPLQRTMRCGAIAPVGPEFPDL
jgi:hypothetical protein